MKKYAILFPYILAFSLLHAQPEKVYLQQIFQAIDSIESISYGSLVCTNVYYPQHKGRSLVYMIKDDSDTYLGVDFMTKVYSEEEETYLPGVFYDGRILARYNPVYKVVEVDTLEGKKIGAKISPPFFIQAASLLKYALSEYADTDVSVEKFNDSTRITLKFDHLVDIVPARLYTGNKEQNGQTSTYIILVKNDMLVPNKIHRVLQNQSNYEEVYDIAKGGSISAGDYIPRHALIKEKGFSDKVMFEEYKAGYRCSTPSQGL